MRKGRINDKRKVGVQPVDALGDIWAQSERMGASPLNGDGGEVDGGDVPAMVGKPDGICAFAAPDVERGTGNEVIRFVTSCWLGPPLQSELLDW